MRKVYLRIFNGVEIRIKSAAFLIAFFSFIFGSVSLNAQTISGVTVSGAPVCAGSNISLTFDATNGGPGFHYSNSTVYTVYLSDASGNNFQSIGTFSTSGVSYSTIDNEATNVTLSNITIPVTNVTGAGYKISVTSVSPVYNGVPTTNLSSAFTINGQLTPTVSIAIDAPNTKTICAGTSVTFRPTPTNGGTTPTYQWYVGATPVATGSTFTSTSLANADQVKVVMTPDPTSCTSASTATSNVITMTVNNQVAPDVSISANPGNTICPRQNVTFSATSITNGGSNPTYQWKLNSSSIATTPTYSSSLLANGDIVSLDLTSSAACAVPATKSSNQITMVVNPGTPATPGSIA